MKFDQKSRELRLDDAALDALGYPQRVNTKPYLTGFLITAEGHPDLDPLDFLRGVDYPRRAQVNMKIHPKTIAALNLRDGFYRWTNVSDGQTLCLPDGVNNDE